jgi:hypothetical protein
MTTVTEKAANYTAAQEQMIRDAAPLNLEKATALGVQMGKKARSIIAKAVRMEVPYEKKGPVTKTGEAVVRKETLVEQIRAFTATGSNLEGLEKASKPALIAVLAALKA